MAAKKYVQLFDSRRNATDQILIIMALAAGKSTIRAPKPLTLHTVSMVKGQRRIIYYIQLYIHVYIDI